MAVPRRSALSLPSGRRLIAWWIALLILYAGLALVFLWKPQSQSSTFHVRPRPNRQRANVRKSLPDQSSLSNTTLYDARVWQRLQSAGVSVDTLRQHAAQLPRWSTIVAHYGTAPVLLGSGQNLERTCRAYRQRVAPTQRVLGAAGMFSTGTNLVTQLLKHNCYIPERFDLYGGSNATKEQLGIRWQVPWGKHTPAHYKWRHAASEKASSIGKNDVLPIITVRNPWRWMQSMCKNPYAAKWPHREQCPNLKSSIDGAETWNAVTVKYGAGSETYTSLTHLWNDWYNGYTNVSLLPVQEQEDNPPLQDESLAQWYPWIMVRMEDLVFHTVETITAVCECAGGRLYENTPFRYITESAKADSPGHDTTTGLTQAWIKYSQPLQPYAGFAVSDYAAALATLDTVLMERLQYQNPPTRAAK